MLNWNLSFGFCNIGVRLACAVVQCTSDAREPQQQAADEWALPLKKIHLISCGSMNHVSDIKLIRTDTTLDLSQKAEKGMLLSFPLVPFLLLSSSFSPCSNACGTHFP